MVVGQADKALQRNDLDRLVASLPNADHRVFPGWHCVSASFRDFTAQPLQDKSQVRPGVKPRPQRATVSSSASQCNVTMDVWCRGPRYSGGIVIGRLNQAPPRRLYVNVARDELRFMRFDDDARLDHRLTFNASSKSKSIEPLVIRRG